MKKVHELLPLMDRKGFSPPLLFFLTEKCTWKAEQEVGVNSKTSFMVDELDATKCHHEEQLSFPEESKDFLKKLSFSPTCSKIS